MERIDERQEAQLQRIVLEVRHLDPLVMPSFASIAAVRQVVNAVQDVEAELRILPKQRDVGSTPEVFAEGRFREALRRITEAKADLESECARLSKPGKRS